MELGAKGEGPTVLMWFVGAAAVVAAALLGEPVVLLFDGEDVRPRVDGRGMCLDFWYSPRERMARVSIPLDGQEDDAVETQRRKEYYAENAKRRTCKGQGLTGEVYDERGMLGA